jgi:hypothetical protein
VVKDPASKSPAAEVADSEPTGLPGFRSWGRVYAFVVAWFLACVLLLFLLTEVFR